MESTTKENNSSNRGKVNEEVLLNAQKDELLQNYKVLEEGAKELKSQLVDEYEVVKKQEEERVRLDNANNGDGDVEKEETIEEKRRQSSMATQVKEER